MKAVETLLANDKAALKAFRAKQILPFTAFEDVPKSEDEEEKPFLQCHYNEAEGAYRSPWSNRFYKVIVKGNEEEIDIFEKKVKDEDKDLRMIEYAANEVWDAYTNLYYGITAIGSAFLRPTDKGSFEGIFGIRKRTDKGGSWDSVHLVHVGIPNEKEKTCDYKVESAVVCAVRPHTKTSVSSSFTKETTKTCNIRPSEVTGSHLENLGLIMEQVEIDFRSKMERVDMPKTLEVMESIYRKQRMSATAHLMGGGDGGTGEEPSMATGMGVGAGMISEIANLAQKRQSNPNSFMEEMKKREQEANDKLKEDHDSGGAALADLKKTLKKSPEKKIPPKAPSASPEFMDFRKSLKKTGRLSS